MSKFAYVGTYNSEIPYPDKKTEGIYVFEVDPLTGSFKFIETVESDRASFLCLNSKRDRLYVVNELNRYEGQNGEITSFKVDTNSGKLTKLNTVTSLGVSPCHLCLDPCEIYVLAANYGSGSVAVYSLKPDGSIDKNTDLVINTGSGPKERQSEAHAHMITFDHKKEKAMLVDLGIDKTLFYSFDNIVGKLALLPGLSCDANPGAGPRHIVESKDSQFYYIINELDATVSVYSAVPSSNGKFPLLQTTTTLPTNVTVEDTFLCAEIMLHPNGKFLYGSNRGHDSIVIYSVDVKSGLLCLIDHVPTRGSYPRHFQIHPNGKFMFVANQQSDNITTFEIDGSTGRLTFIGTSATVPAPVCIMFN